MSGDRCPSSQQMDILGTYQRDPRHQRFVYPWWDSNQLMSSTNAGEPRQTRNSTYSGALQTNPSERVLTVSKRARNSELGKRSGARAIDGHVRTPITTETLAAFAEGTRNQISRRTMERPFAARAVLLRCPRHRTHEIGCTSAASKRHRQNLRDGYSDNTNRPQFSARV